MNLRILVAASSLLLSPLIVAFAQDSSGYSPEEFLSATAIREAQISPDGQRVAFTTQRSDFAKDRAEMALWRIDLTPGGRKIAAARLTTAPANYWSPRWSPDGRYLAFLSDRQPAATGQLFLLDQLGGEPRVVTDPGRFSQGIIGFDWVPDGSLVVAAAGTSRGTSDSAGKGFYGDATRYRESTPHTTFFRIDPTRQNPACDSLLTVPYTIEAFRLSPDGRLIGFGSGPPAGFGDNSGRYEIFVVARDGRSPPRQLTRNQVVEFGPTWSRDGSSLYVSGGVGEDAGPRGQETQGRIYRIGVTDARVERVGPSFGGSLSETAALPDGSLLTVGTLSTSSYVYRLDPATGGLRRLTSAKGSVRAISASRDGKRLSFVFSGPKAFPELFLAGGVEDIATASQVTEFNAALSARPAPAVETVRWPDAEGDTVEGVLYWPTARRGMKNLPLVVRIHGGPSATDLEELAGGWFGPPALLASRGYLVLEPNYRGSIGRGDEYMRKIAGFACSRPVKDILSGVDYLVGKGWADSTRLGVMGYSYGGVLTDCLLGRTTRFRAAASGAGVWNYTSRFGTSDNWMTYDYLYRGKAPWEDLQGIWGESAIGRAGSIRTPTLVLHGGADHRVPTSQSYELYRALLRLGVPSELVILPGEDHGFTKPSHMLTGLKAGLDWIDHYLLGTPRATGE